MSSEPVSAPGTPSPTNGARRDIFSMIDKNGDGVISRDEWSQAVRGNSDVGLTPNRTSPTSMASTSATTPPRAGGGFAFGMSRTIGSGLTPPRMRPSGDGLTPPRMRGSEALKGDGASAAGGSARGVSPGPQSIAKQAEWEKEIQDLDKKEAELHQNQMRLLREQLASVSRELLNVTQTVAELQKQRGMDASQLSTLQEQWRQEHKDGRDEILARVNAFHQILDDHRHESRSQLEALRGDHGSHGSAIGDLQRDWARRETEHVAVQDRLVEYARKLSSLQQSHEEQIGLFSNHAQDFEELKNSHSRHASIPERLSFIERLLGESADVVPRLQLDRLSGAAGAKAAGPALTFKNRLDELEQALGLHAERHGSFMEKHAQIESHNASLAERVDFLEQALGDSADKHMKELQAMRDAHSQHAGHLQQLQGLHSHHATMEERINYVERLLGDSADDHSASPGGIQERLSTLETAVGDTHVKYSKAIQSLQSSHERHASAMTRHASDLESLSNRHVTHAGDHSTLAERVCFLEQQLGDSADGPGDAVAEFQPYARRGLQDARSTNGRVAGTVGERLQVLEMRVVEDRKALESCCGRMNMLRDAWNFDTPVCTPRGF